MFLYIVRHAWAGHFGDPGWADDSQRPLTPEGVERFRRMADLLVERGAEPEMIATSPYVRCRQTAELLSMASGDTPIVELAALRPGSNLAKLAEWTQEQGVDKIAWVGHAPDVGQLTAAMIGRSDADIRFAKGACAALRFDSEPWVGGGQLYWLATAKLLGC